MRDLTAIILAAGVGKRFGPELAERPKSMLEVGGETLIERLVRQLRASGVERVVVVVGHGRSFLERVLEGADGVVLLENPDYRRGAILSLWTARRFLEGPVLVMDADVFVPDALMRRLVESPQPSCFLLDGRVPPSGEEQMLMVRDGRVRDIARLPRGEFDLLGESVGFLKLAGTATPLLRDLLAQRIERGEIDLEHEDVYPDLLAQVEVGFERVDDLDWTEVDFPADLERARAIAAALG